MQQTLVKLEPSFFVSNTLLIFTAALATEQCYMPYMGKLDPNCHRELL
jgi:hypothetical protein